MLHLVRHGRPLVVRGMPAAEWDLDPGSYDDVWALRASGRLPTRAAWFSSPEPKAIQTAQLLTDADVGVLPDLRRTWSPWATARLGRCLSRSSPGGRPTLIGGRRSVCPT